METNSAINTESTQHPNKNLFTFIIITVLLVCAIGIIVAYFSKPSREIELNNTSQVVSPVQQMPAIEATAGVAVGSANIYIVRENAISKIPVNIDAKLLIKATSTENISGYQLVFKLDPSAVMIRSVKVGSSNFDIIESKYENGRIMYALKKESVKNHILFKDATIAEVVIRPLKKGILDFGVLDKSGKQKSKFVNESVQDVIPSLKSIQLDIY
ncbi:MAG: hypothetical protein WCO06_04810 [Candidatus Roizmanbacteria bacterium]